METTLPDVPTLEFDKAEIASLSHAEIRRMSAPNLVEAIRAADLPTLDAEGMSHVEFLDPEALRRVLFLARECCRHQGH